ncbi:MAG TPA: DUF6328 family protein [Reyranella sp.]
MQSAQEHVHRETLEQEATHATDEARMVLPGVQAVLGFQLIAVFNQRFELFSPAEQVLHLGAFLLVALAMGLMMTPAAYHRQAERGVVTRRFVDLTSALLTAAMVPLIAGISIDAYLIARLILAERMAAGFVAGGVAVVLASLWYALPAFCRRLKS